MGGEAASDELGRLAGRALEKSVEAAEGLRAKALAVWRRTTSESTEKPGLVSSTAGEATPDRDGEVIDVDLTDALARAEAAEAEVERLRSELAHKEEILAEARVALRTARLALRDHLRITRQ